MVRPVLDFAAVAYHNILTKRQAEEIERLQLRSMKIVIGDTVSYGTVIASGQIETLEERRTKLLEKLALKTANNPRFNETWFPVNPDIKHNLRRRDREPSKRRHIRRADFIFYFFWGTCSLVQILIL